MSLEAAELLEITQWKGDEEVEAAVHDTAFRERLAEECADVLIYLLLIAERASLDLPRAAADKIAKNETKYPVEKSLGKVLKYTEL